MTLELDYLTSISQLFDCLLILVCLSGNLTVFLLLDCYFLTIWLSFSYSTVFLLFDSLSAFWLCFGYLTVFSAIWLSVCYLKLFECFPAIWLSFGFLTVFSAIWLSSDYLTVFSDCLLAIWLSFVGYLSIFWAIWLSFLQFHCLLVIRLSFGYLTSTRITLESHLNYTRIALEWH